jgi:TPR repeat protein
MGRGRTAIAAMLLAAACSKTGEPPPPAAEVRGSEESRLLRQCDGGTNAACESLETLYLQANRRADVTALVKRLCDGGRRYFCPTFAFALANGDGIAADPGRARQLFTDTCKDDPNGCSEYGSLYVAGRGVKKDDDLGCFLLDLACTYHDDAACRDVQYCAPQAGLRQ